MMASEKAALELSMTQLKKIAELEVKIESLRWQNKIMMIFVLAKDATIQTMFAFLLE